MPTIVPGVFQIPGQDEFIPDSHTYILGDPSGNDLSLVDPGLVGKGGYKLDAMKRAGMDPRNIRRVLMTHTHMDHIGCLAEILAAVPEAELWVHREEGVPLQTGDDRSVYGMDMFKEMCRMQYGIGPDAFRFKVHRLLEGGETLEIGGLAWEVLHIPGHSLGSIGLYCKALGLLIPGDVVYADHAIGRFDLYGAHGPTLARSLGLLADLDVKILLPGHNATVLNCPQGYIQRTLAQWEAYLA